EGAPAAAPPLELPDRRTVDHVVEARQRLTEEFLEAQADVVQLGEDEAAVVVHMPHRRHAARSMAVGKARAVVARLQRHAGQAAVEAEGPGMVGAAEEAADIATGLAGQPRAFVRTAVVQNFDAVWGIPHPDGGLPADRRGVVVAEFRDLAVVADIDPGGGKEMLHLQLEQLLVEIKIAMDLGLAHKGGDGLSIASVFADHRKLSMVLMVSSS